MFKEFKEFAMRGNVLDLAIGLILGAAFGTIVTSFVNDILMPPIGLALGKVDFTNLFIDLSGKGFRHAGRGKGGGRAHCQHWRVSECGHQFPDSCPRDLLAGPPDQPAQDPARGNSDQQALLVLLLRYPGAGHPVPELHVDLESGVVFPGQKTSVRTGIPAE